MLDYQKNMHADSVVREFIAVEPSFLALFGVEALLQVEGARKMMMNVLKIYIERRDHFARIENIVEELFESETLRVDLITKLKGKSGDEQITRSEVAVQTRTTSSFNSSRKTGKLDTNSSVSSFMNSTQRNKKKTLSDKGNTSPKDANEHSDFKSAINKLQSDHELG